MGGGRALLTGNCAPALNIKAVMLEKKIVITSTVKGMFNLRIIAVHCRRTHRILTSAMTSLLKDLLYFTIKKC
jgi:hypothetical protein